VLIYCSLWYGVCPPGNNTILGTLLVPSTQNLCVIGLAQRGLLGCGTVPVAQVVIGANVQTCNDV